MTTATTTLADWLLERLAEDEAVARAAHGERWGLDEIADVWSGGHDDAPILVATRLEEVIATHIARHDPARVLREVAAKRAIVEAHWTQVEDDDPGAWIVGSGVILRALASVYAGAPGWREEWAL